MPLASYFTDALGAWSTLAAAIGTIAAVVIVLYRDSCARVDAALTSPWNSRNSTKRPARGACPVRSAGSCSASRLESGTPRVATRRRTSRYSLARGGSWSPASGTSNSICARSRGPTTTQAGRTRRERRCRLASLDRLSSFGSAVRPIFGESWLGGGAPSSFCPKRQSRRREAITPTTTTARAKSR